MGGPPYPTWIEDIHPICAHIDLSAGWYTTRLSTETPAVHLEFPDPFFIRRCAPEGRQ